jgi:hypothetical protein
MMSDTSIVANLFSAVESAVASPDSSWKFQYPEGFLYGQAVLRKHWKEPVSLAGSSATRK